MKKIILGMLVLMSQMNAIESKDIQEIILNQTISTMGDIKDGIVNTFNNPPIIDGYSKEKSYWVYFKENNELKKKLSEKKINYHVLVKQKIARKGLFISREDIVLENQILKRLAITNNIINSEDRKITKTDENENAKNDLLKQMNN